MRRPLENALDAVFPSVPDRCERCGAPNLTLGSLIILRPGDEILECTDCGRPVTASGLSLTPLRPSGALHILRLARDPTDSPPDPLD